MIYQTMLFKWRLSHQCQKQIRDQNYLYQINLYNLQQQVHHQLQTALLLQVKENIDRLRNYMNLVDLLLLQRIRSLLKKLIKRKSGGVRWKKKLMSLIRIIHGDCVIYPMARNQSVLNGCPNKNWSRWWNSETQSAACSERILIKIRAWLQINILSRSSFRIPSSCSSTTMGGVPIWCEVGFSQWRAQWRSVC